MKTVLSVFILWVASIGLLQCASYAEKSADMREGFYKGEFDTAIDIAREEYQDASSKDKLLWLMEAGIIYHTHGKYKKSNKVFAQAAIIADHIQTKITKTVLAFALNDRSSNFKGESYERVLIRLYMALNSLSLGDIEVAKRHMRKLDYEQREMKMGEKMARQNLLARYLDAIISEHIGKLNDARVQYKNLLRMQKNSMLITDRYILAKKEGSSGARYRRNGKKYLLAFDSNMEKKPYSKKMGELILLVQGGKAARKFSRGKIVKGDTLFKAFAVGMQSYMLAHSAFSGSGLSLSAVMIGFAASAENPIPIYKQLDKMGIEPHGIVINDKPVGKTIILNDYTNTAIQNFNDNYVKMVAKNTASMVTKFAVAYIASYAVGKAAAKQLQDKFGAIAGQAAMLTVGLAAGAAGGATIRPDLRSWTLLPSNFQIRRIFLEPGEYNVQVRVPGAGGKLTKAMKVTIKEGKPTFVMARSIKHRFWVAGTGVGEAITSSWEGQAVD